MVMLLFSQQILETRQRKRGVNWKQAGADARTSMCGLRSNGDHLLSILTNYGALSGLVTALCRYIANTWKGCRRKKLERTTQI